MPGALHGAASAADSALYPAAAAGKKPRISPTVVSQFVRLDQCRRYLRLALHERTFGPRFLHDYHVTAQPIQPLLTRAGAEFEERVEADAARRFTTRKFASGRLREGKPDNDAVVAAAKPPGGLEDKPLSGEGHPDWKYLEEGGPEGVRKSLSEEIRPKTKVPG